MSDFASSVSTDPKEEAPGDAALLHLLDGYYIKRHSVNPWNTSGGYCDVFTGDHPTFGKVALKRPRGNQCDESNLRNFRREARIWKELQHPHVLQFVGIIDAPSHMWLVSVFAENGRLHDYLSTHKAADRHSLVLQFTSGLAYLHSKDVVHGDLKADNLLISSNKDLLIADFGLSKMKGMSTYTSKKGVGSVRWMAPELLEGDEEEEAIKTSSSDVYAYGITLSEILRGELPFKQYTNMVTLVRAILKNKRPPIPEEPTLGTPHAILWIAAKDCWDAKPSKRPTMVDICCRFAVDYRKAVDSVIPGVATSADETSHVFDWRQVESSLPEETTLNQGVDLNPQPANLTTSPQESSDNRLLHLLGNTEHGDIGHMLDEGLCLEGTRVEILDRLDAWAADHQYSPRIMLLKGQAGRGKSTISRSVSSRYRKRWGADASSAIFHFRRGNEGLNTRPVLALARQLGSSANQRVRTAILKSIGGHEDVAQLRLEEQFEVLFVQPFKQLEADPPRILLVIDALDECSDHSLVSALLRLIRKHALLLPSTVKFLLTTRPEEPIVGPFRIFPDSDQEDLDAVDLALIDRDVRSYFTTRLSGIQHEYGFDEDWVPPKAIDEMVSLSQGLFQWAHAAMEYVRERPRLNLRRLIKSPTNLLGLPALYKQILSTAFPLREDIKEDSNFLALIQHVIGSLVVAHRPMSPVTLEYLWDNTPGHPPISYPAMEIRDGILGRLGSIIMLPTTPESSVHFMHASVRDFFTDPAQCKDKRLFIDPSVHHARLAIICFNRMEENLKHSIRSINVASKMESEAINLVERRLSSGLQYCCRSWSTHLSETRGDQPVDFAKVQRAMQGFCMERLPCWIEGLSLTGILTEAFDMIRRATKWLEGTKCPPLPSGIPATTLLGDTNDFCRQFFKHMSTYPQHVTLSHLLHFRSETTLWKVYSDLIRQPTPRIVRGPPLKRFDWSRIIREGDAVLCLAFSPDGKTLASGLRDSTIRLWNMDIGEPMELPLVGHEGRVNGMAFSPDSKTLASGSNDRLIRLWNMDAGEPKGTPLVGHKDQVTSVAYSPDGKTLASGSHDSTIQLWNMESEEPTGTPLLGHSSSVTSVTYSPNGKSIASGSWDTTIRLWTAGKDIEGSAGSPLVHHNKTWVSSAAYSPDGKILAFGLIDGTIQLWSMDTGKPMELRLAGHASGVNGLAFSPDGKTLASGSNDRMVRLWSMDTGEPKGRPLVGHKDQVTSVAYSPDGTTVASGSYDSTLRLWTVETGSGGSMESQLVGHQALVRSIAYSHDGKTLASGSDDHQIRLWDIKTGWQKGKPFDGHRARITGIAFSYDDDTLASGSDDGEIRLWDMDTGVQKRKLLVGHQAQLMSITISSDGEILVTRSDHHRIRVWNIGAGVLMGTFSIGRKNHVSSVDYSPDGNTLAVGLDDGRVRLWTLPAGRRRTVQRRFTSHKANVMVVACSHDGKTLACELAADQIRLWNVETGERMGLLFVGHGAKVTSIAISSNGKTLASGSDDRQIRLWDMETGKEKGQLVARYWGRLTSIALSSDGKILAAGCANAIQLWKLNGARPDSKAHPSHKPVMEGSMFPSVEPSYFRAPAYLGQINIGRECATGALAFSPDGQTLALQLTDHTIQLCDIDTRQPQRAPFVGHQNRVTSLAFSSDGKMIASGSVDGAIVLWNVATGDQKGFPLFGHQSGVTSVGFSLDGETLVSHSSLESDLETTHWILGHGDASMHTTHVGDKDLEDEPPQIVSGEVRLDIDSPEAYERGWVFVRGKRCFWLPPEFYLDRGYHKVDMSLFGERYLVFHHSNIHILDISAFL